MKRKDNYTSRRVRRAAERRDDQTIASMGNYKDLFPAARAIHRKFTLIIGPTNSGKTYQAFQLLKGLTSTAYLGPLRLLAMEGVDNYREHLAAEANMITGEEKILQPTSDHYSMTVELASTLRHRQAVVIDEAQMLTDNDRGPSWVSAIVGTAADHVIVVGSPACESKVKALIDYCGDTLVKTVKTERLCPLEHANESRNSVGTAHIAFSRKEVMQLRDVLIKAGKKPSVIYGALGPEVRRKQAELFRNGTHDCIVATDAIGMGLNLPISEIILTTGYKFDGIEERELDLSEVRQIIGRAGRHGLYPKGYAIGKGRHASELIQRALQSQDKDVEGTVGIWLTREIIEAVSTSTRTKSITQIAEAFTRAATEPVFHSSAPQDFAEKATLVDKYSRLPSVYDRYLLAMTPINLDKNEALYRSWVIRLGQKQIPWTSIPSKPTSDTFELMSYEQAYNAAVAYRWLCQKFPDGLTGFDQCTANMKELSENIHLSLSQKKAGTKKCRQCQVEMPGNYTFGICQDCFEGGGSAKAPSGHRPGASRRGVGPAGFMENSRKNGKPGRRRFR